MRLSLEQVHRKALTEHGIGLHEREDARESDQEDDWMSRWGDGDGNDVSEEFFGRDPPDSGPRIRLEHQPLTARLIRDAILRAYA